LSELRSSETKGCTLQPQKNIRWYAISKSLRTTDVGGFQHLIGVSGYRIYMPIEVLLTATKLLTPFKGRGWTRVNIGCMCSVNRGTGDVARAVLFHDARFHF